MQSQPVFMLLAVYLQLAAGSLKPKFNTTPEHVTVTKGSKAVLPCSVEFLGEHSVIWVNPRNTLISHTDRRMIDDHRISVERPYVKEWNLHIREVRHNDSGIYKCKLNTNPMQEKLVTLSVLVPPMIISRLSSDKVVVREGDTATLVCNVTGIPYPNVTWHKRNYRQGAGRKELSCGLSPPEIGQMGEVLLIHNVSRDCDDIYECYVDNGVPPPVTKAVQVFVEFPAEVILTNRRLGQRVGRETILECAVHAFPQGVTMWSRNGQNVAKLTSSKKFSVELFPDPQNRVVTLSLRISNLDPEDFGTYTCHGSNHLGSDEEDMILYEIEPETTTTSTTTLPTTFGPRYAIPSIPRESPDTEPSHVSGRTNGWQGPHPTTLTPQHQAPPLRTGNPQPDDDGVRGVVSLHGGCAALSKSLITSLLSSFITIVVVAHS